MVYIHQSTCVSTQQNLFTENKEEIRLSEHNVLHVVEPKYEGIPLGILRRMGKAVRMGVGVAMPLIKNQDKPLQGILIGTANGGMEDCIKFLNQVIEFEEGTLTPTNFVQSTTNAIASQLGLLSANKGYNVTHVNRGLAFENALLDVMMLLEENPAHAYLVGGVEEISTYNYNIDFLAGTYKQEEISNLDLYRSTTTGTIAGEGAAMFVVNAKPEGAMAALKGLKLLTLDQTSELEEQLILFLREFLPAGETIDVLLTGENGDHKLSHFIEAVDSKVNAPVVTHYKHLTGDFATASALSLHIACQYIQDQKIPSHMVKTGSTQNKLRHVLIYNHHKGVQHSFMLVSRV